MHMSYVCVFVCLHVSLRLHNLYLRMYKCPCIQCTCIVWVWFVVFLVKCCFFIVALESSLFILAAKCFCLSLRKSKVLFGISNYEQSQNGLIRQVWQVFRESNLILFCFCSTLKGPSPMITIPALAACNSECQLTQLKFAATKMVLECAGRSV